MMIKYRLVFLILKKKGSAVLFEEIEGHQTVFGYFLAAFILSKLR
ncbi:hypothetical protein [Planococcus maritimus]|nr:hypothetical protein [Planococcus maritimus]